MIRFSMCGVGGFIERAKMVRELGECIYKGREGLYPAAFCSCHKSLPLPQSPANR